MAQLVGQGHPRHYVLDQPGAVAAVEAAQDHRRHPRPADPGRLELGAVGHQDQHGQAEGALDRQLHELHGGRVDPVHVLEDEEDRMAALALEGGHDQRRLALVKHVDENLHGVFANQGIIDGTKGNTLDGIGKDLERSPQRSKRFCDK